MGILTLFCLHKTTLVFDCEIEVYWWVLCIEKYFKKWFTPKIQKLAVTDCTYKERFGSHMVAPMVSTPSMDDLGCVHYNFSLTISTWMEGHFILIRWSTIPTNWQCWWTIINDRRKNLWFQLTFFFTCYNGYKYCSTRLLIHKVIKRWTMNKSEKR